MPYAGIRCQFAANLQVITPYGRGRSLPTWWPFSPGAIVCSIGPNSLPLVLSTVALAFFFAGFLTYRLIFC